MWSHWSGVTKKLKDIAVEIATPQYEQPEGSEEEEESQQQQQTKEKEEKRNTDVKGIAHEDPRRQLLPVLQQAHDEKYGIHTPLPKDPTSTFQTSNSNSSSDSKSSHNSNSMMSNTKSHTDYNRNMNNMNKLSGVELSETTITTPPVRRSIPSEVVLMPPARNPHSTTTTHNTHTANTITNTNTNITNTNTNITNTISTTPNFSHLSTGGTPPSVRDSQLNSLDKSSEKKEEKEKQKEKEEKEKEKESNLALKRKITTTTTTTVDGNGSLSVCNHEGLITELREQLHVLSAEKQQLETQIQIYEKERTMAEEKSTSNYYESQRLISLQEEVENEKKAKEEVMKELQHRDSECVKLRNEVQTLQERVERLTRESAAISLAHRKAEESLSLREEEYIKAMQQMESLQDAYNALRAESERVKESLKTSTLTTTLPGTTNINNTNINNTTVPIARSDALMEKDITSMPSVTVEELRKHIERLEEEKLAIQCERDQLLLSLETEQDSHRRTSEEKYELLQRSEEQAIRLTELIKQLEYKQQDEKQRREEDEKKPVESTQEKQEKQKEMIYTLQSEITSLKTQLEAAKREVAETAHRVESKLTAEHTHAINILNEEAQQQREAAVHAIQCELHETQERAIKAETQRNALEEELQHVQSRLSESDSHTALLSSKLAAAETSVAELQSNLAATKAESLNKGQEASILAALTTRKRELEAENARLQELLQQLEHTITECLVRGDVELPTRFTSSSTLQREDIGASFSDKVILLASEFNRLVDVNRRAGHVQKEWERTYEQARGVNATLTQQVNEAWKTIGTLREDLSVRDQSLAKLKQQLQAEKQQFRDAQQALSGVTNELQALQEEKKLMETQMSVVGVGSSTSNNNSNSNSNNSGHNKNSLITGNQHDQIAALNADIDTLKRALHERDEELSQTQMSLDNLQQVLDTFTQNKSRDVEERTVDMQIEIEKLSAKLEAAEEQQRSHQEEIDKLIANHRREIAAKNLEITSMHRKLADLRRALDETARQLNGDMMIDKRVISHLTVNYIHAFVAQRPEADEMLKVLSGLLNWDEEMQEKAGLLPGPSNPRPGQQGKRRGLIGGFVNTVLGSPGRPRDSTGGISENNNNNNNNNNKSGGGAPSISELWVEFLIRESEAGIRESAEDPSLQSTTTNTITNTNNSNSNMTPSASPPIPVLVDVSENKGEKDNGETVTTGDLTSNNVGQTAEKTITDGEVHNSEKESTK